MPSQTGNSPLDNRLLSGAVLVLLLALVFGLWLWLPGYLRKAEPVSFGDSFDAVGALFTGLAFAGLIFTIFLQQRQIKLPREDFVSQIEEMKLSRAEIAEQVKVQKNLLALGVAELRMKPLEVRIEEIQLQQSSKTPGLEKVRADMEAIIEALRKEIDERAKVYTPISQ
jgi:hypothetical protein